MFGECVESNTVLGMLMKNLVGKMSQTEMIREYLEAGHAITDLEALNHFRIRRLASRMHELKDGGL